MYLLTGHFGASSSQVSAEVWKMWLQDIPWIVMSAAGTRGLTGVMNASICIVCESNNNVYLDVYKDFNLTKINSLSSAR